MDAVDRESAVIVSDRLAPFTGVVVGCCMGAEGAHACQCAPLERTVHGLCSGRDVRDLSVRERRALVQEVSCAGLLDAEECKSLSNRDMAVLLQGAWNSEQQD